MELKEGEFYHIDKDHANGGKVKLLYLNGKHFCGVADADDLDHVWQTMQNRLSEWIEPVSPPSEASEQKGEDIKCPFCDLSGFDKIGLKYHLRDTPCQQYLETPLLTKF